MTPVFSIGELQKKTSQFNSKQSFFIQDKRKKKIISIVIPYEGEENSEILEEVEKFLQEKFSFKNPKKRVFISPFKDRKMTDSDWKKFWEADKEI